MLQNGAVDEEPSENEDEDGEEEQWQLEHAQGLLKLAAHSSHGLPAKQR